MKIIYSIRDLPNEPAIYALYSGHAKGEYVVYVGATKKLRQRVEQHLIKHDSSITTGKSAVKLETQFLSKLKWWEEPRFSSRARLEAAELVASDLLKPALVSRGNSRKDSRELFKDSGFYESMKKLIVNPSGALILLTAEERIQKLEDRIAYLEEQMNSKR